MAIAFEAAQIVDARPKDLFPKQESKEMHLHKTGVCWDYRLLDVAENGLPYLWEYIRLRGKGGSDY